MSEESYNKYQWVIWVGVFIVWILVIAGFLWLMSVLPKTGMSQSAGTANLLAIIFIPVLVAGLSAEIFDYFLRKICGV